MKIAEYKIRFVLLCLLLSILFSMGSAAFAFDSKDVLKLWETNNRLDIEIKENLEIQKFIKNFDIGYERPKFLFEDQAGNVWMIKFYHPFNDLLQFPEREYIGYQLTSLFAIKMPITVPLKIKINGQNRVGSAQIFLKGSDLSKVNINALTFTQQTQYILHQLFDILILNPDFRNNNYFLNAEDSNIYTIDKDTVFSIIGLNNKFDDLARNDEGPDADYIFEKQSVIKLNKYALPIMMSPNDIIFAQETLEQFFSYLHALGDKIFLNIFQTNSFLFTTNNNNFFNAYIKYKEKCVNHYLPIGNSNAFSLEDSANKYKAKVIAYLKNEIHKKEILIKTLKKNSSFDKKKKSIFYFFMFFNFEHKIFNILRLSVNDSIR